VTIGIIFTAIWYILWQFGTVCGHLVYISPFWYVGTNKNLATLNAATSKQAKKWNSPSRQRAPIKAAC
jgi:hypothetical protein